MARRIVLLLIIAVLLTPALSAAETRFFLGTRTGWERTRETFLEGRYKGHKMFLIIGARPTGEALNDISHWKSRTTYIEDVRRGGRCFGDQAMESIKSVPNNGGALGRDVINLLADPVREIRDINLITPATIVYKTVANVAKIGWHGAKLVGEPVVRFGGGTVALVGSPFIKPVTYTGVSLIYTGTAVYGYGSSAAGGTVMLGATGAVLGLDVATSPLTAVYELSRDKGQPPAESQAAERPASWAQPVSLPGVPNLHRVSTNLYRSAQPDAEGMKSLKQLGIVTVVNLRSFHSDGDELAQTGLAYEHLPMKAWHPEHDELVRFLQIVTHPLQTPVLVHCQHGADRTGTLCALYRVIVQGWTKEEAIREMKEGGFGFHEIWANLPAWIEGLDIEAIKREAGIGRPR